MDPQTQWYQVAILILNVAPFAFRSIIRRGFHEAVCSGCVSVREPIARACAWGAAAAARARSEATAKSFFLWTRLYHASLFILFYSSGTIQTQRHPFDTATSSQWTR